MRAKCVVSGVLAAAITAVCIGGYVKGFSPEAGSEAQTYRWKINGNGFEGILTYAVSDNRVIGDIDGLPIEGYQVGRNIVFYKPNAQQIWTGWIYDPSYGGRQTTIAGTFSHRGENSYPWHGYPDDGGSPPVDHVPGNR